ncbi:MAG: L-threonylcarbamoyladenylate synthase [Candidatus Kerfeldbacteria bacterium]|nr:L-threonylcarbamoyladenylate synthase [Candidatus Kerfeldbacteria bacterium]
MRRIRLTQENHQEVIESAIQVLKSGDLIIYPTETCYGVGADATHEKAIAKLLAYKTKRNDKPISVAVTDAKMASKYIHINSTARNIYDNFLPGPITVVSRSKGKLAKGVESIMGTQGIRIPDYPLVLELLKQYKKPITSTSANASYKKTPYTIADILRNTTKKQQSMIGLIIDAGRLPKRKPSTVVDATNDTLAIVREGSMQLKGSHIFNAYSLDDTQRFVKTLTTKFKNDIGKRGVVFLLQGNLGAGKTHFTKFLATELGVKHTVVSPTFLICREYPGKFNRRKVMLQHIDTYRFYDAKEMDELHPTTLFQAPNVVVIEWANKVHDYITRFLRNAVVVKIVITVTGEHARSFAYSIHTSKKA